ncbi:hypothetical protein EIP91_011985 [Steccherinum ochraceum]|uniref:Uncharacterized protein n=1 Tax=Steccherinum ochraceum TaxID=92696 RepID=A0A4R0RLB1_9APHY|nr:hypothetical protein EIP91_011985 [Steccherinum ochraceum]
MSFRRIVQAAVIAPFSNGRRSTNKNVNPDTQDMDEEAQTRRPLLKVDLPGHGPSMSYGSTNRPRLSPERNRRDSALEGVPEEEQILEDSGEVAEPEDLDWELEEQDLYSGSYRRVVALYTFVPLSTLLVLALLAALPSWVWPVHDTPPLPHSPYFPSPLPEILVSFALWSLSHLIRVPLWTIFSAALRSLHPALVTILFQLAYALIYNLLRLSAIPVLRLRHEMDFPSPTWHDLTFRRVWWLALGWAAIETTVGIVQDYQQIALYKDVMIPEEKINEVMGQPGSGSASRFGESQEEILVLSPRSPDEMPALQRHDSGASDGVSQAASAQLDEAIELEVDRDIERLVNLKEREELEEIYGIPIIRIPVFLSCLQRIDSIIITLGITLILSATYLRSRISISISTQSSPPLSSNHPFLVTFPLTLLLNTFLSLLYTPLVLPRIGVHTTAYIGFLVGLGCLFTGLGLWRALS